MATRSRKRLSQAERRAATRANLLRAARSVFGKRGYHASSLDEIAEKAGVSKGALYYNFDGKEDLFLALLDERIAERVQELDRVLGSSEPSEAAVEAAVGAAALDAIHAAKQSREWRLLFLEFVAHAAREPRFRREFAIRLKRMRDTLAKLVERQTSALGVELTLPADQLAIAINALGNGLAMEALVTPDEVSDELMGEILLLALRGAATGAR